MLVILLDMAAIVGPGPDPGRRATLCTAASLLLNSHSPVAYAAASIEKGAPAFGTAESRTGLLDGIKSAFSEKTGEELASEYARSPADISGVASALPSAFATARDVAIIFHGSGGPDRETTQVLARFRQQDAAAGLSREVVVFDWMPWFTSNTNRLSFQSASVGAELGRSLAANRALRSLHIVGTSAGSFAADACCSAYVARAGTTGAAGAGTKGAAGAGAEGTQLAASAGAP